MIGSEVAPFYSRAWYRGIRILLEDTHQYSLKVALVFTSTNKVYSDRFNLLPLVEVQNRWEVAPDQVYHNSIPKETGVDQSVHTSFGASTLDADALLVQEYGQ